MQVTMLTAQSQTIKKLIVDRSFLWMVSPAQRLIAKVTVVIEMFAKTKLLPGVAFTWRIVCVLLLVKLNFICSDRSSYSDGGQL